MLCFRGGAVATRKNLANLDALIRREDFEVEVPKIGRAFEGGPQLKLYELEKDNLFFKLLRKPDFQRRTAHWTPEKICGFVTSFASGDLIPSVIFWQSDASGHIFVIDGAHRISALIAWVHDDYGDRDLSNSFFEGNIPKEQKDLAAETRNLIAQKLGSYTEIKHSSNPTPARARFASNIATGGVTLQWVRGDATRAYHSFHTINTEQTPISDLEIRIIRDRQCANVLSTRALVQAGTGQIVRSSFSEENKLQIRDIAKAIYDDLFVPELETPIKTLELPVAGRSYPSDSLETILDLVEFLNKRPALIATDGKPKRAPKLDILDPTMPDDADGTETLAFLRNVKKSSSLISGNKGGSLGLHPAVYFYSATGLYQRAALLATISFIQELQKKEKLILFTNHRHDFEELLVQWKYFINFIVQRYGSGSRSLGALIAFYQYLFDGIAEEQRESEILPTILKDDRLVFLETKIDREKGTSKEFSSERKLAVFLRKALEAALRCEICGARIHSRSFNIDHDIPKREGGTGSVENGRLTHPFCNSSRDAVKQYERSSATKG